MKSKRVTYIYGRGHSEHDNVFTNIGSPKFFASPITAELADAALKNKISIIFSQGDFHLSPLLCAILQDNKKRDILIGLPQTGFKAKSKSYAKEYYSLYSQKAGAQFFYQNTIWCNASFQETRDSVPKLLLDDIKTTPNWGQPRVKKAFAENFPRLIEQGACKDWPRVLVLPIKYVFPDKILESTNFFYQGNTITLDPFSPKFVILEDINERFRGNVSMLEPLVRNLNEQGIGAVFHFSWPYIRGASSLMSNLSDLGSSVCKIHMGKRYCLEMQKLFEEHILGLDPQTTDMGQFQDKHPAFSRFSIESESWESYYSSQRGENTTKVILATDTPVTATSLEDLAELDGPFDQELEEVHSNLSGLQVPPRVKMMFEFPPFMDSFLFPSDLKINAPFDDTYRWLPLEEAIPRMADPDDIIVRKYVDICRQMNNVKNLTYQIQGQQVHNSVGKSTSLMNYLYDLIFSDSLDSSEEIIVATYGSRGGLLGKLLGRIKTFFEQVSKSNLGPYESIGNNYRILNSPRLNSHFSILELETTEVPQHNVIEVEITRNDGKYRIKVFVMNYDQLSNYAGGAIGDKRLLLPGPLPLAYLDGGNLILPRGFDHMVKPYKEINIFTYPGKNSEQLKLQIDAINKLLYGDLSEPIVHKDLSNSIEHNPKKLAVGIPGRPGIKPISITEEDSEVQDSFDQNIREEISENFVNTSSAKNVDLKKIWDKIGHRKERDESSSVANFDTHADYIDFSVKFIMEDTRSRVRLNRNSFVDVVTGEGSIQIRASELKKGDHFAHLEISDRSSLADFFIHNFADEQHKDLEQIRSPFDNLFAFVEALYQVRPGLIFGEVDFSKLNWLSKEAKENLFNLVHFLRVPQNSAEDHKSTLEKMEKLVLKSEVWNRLKVIFDGENDAWLLQLKHLFEYAENRLICYFIAKLFGIKIAERTFSQRLLRVERGEPNYFFQEEKDMKVIGALIGNADVEENFAEYNNSGRQVSTVLQQLGVSLGRVIRGEDNPMNEMDAIIRQNVKFCEVL